MPRTSATVRAPAGIKPDATSASHPSAAAATVSNCAATNSAATRGASAGVDGFLSCTPCTKSRTDLPAGTIGTPTRASRSAKSGGTHIRTSAPSSRNATASPNNGSTSPRDPHVDINTRIFATPISAGSGFGQPFWGTTRVLPQAPMCDIC